LLERGENAYKVGVGDGASKEQTLRRSTQSKLSKICSENIDTIASRSQGVQLSGPEDLSIMVRLVVKKTFAEPPHCETYADLVYKLSIVLSPVPPQNEGEKPETVKSTLLNLCQDEFESMPRTDTELKEAVPEKDRGNLEGYDNLLGKQKARMKAKMKLLGQLFLRRLFTTMAIGTIVMGLLATPDESQGPAEHIVKCTCEFIMGMGQALEQHPLGKIQLRDVIGCLTDLTSRKDKSIDEARYSKRIQFMIQDLTDAQKANWITKSHNAAAETKE